MLRRKFSINPLLFPILFFGVAIWCGSLLLYVDGSVDGTRISFVDALFTATSATCVTGLAVVDTGTAFSRFGHGVILFLIQIGGLGVMTLASLGLYLMRQRVSLTDRIAVGQNLLHDTGFRLGRFLIAIVVITFLIEGVGAGLLYLLLPGEMSPFSAVFHSISAFCNAGFSLNSDSLVRWQDRWGVNLVFMALIIIGGIGFSVIVESLRWLQSRLPGHSHRKRQRFSWYSRVVFSTSAALVFGGALLLFINEYVAFDRPLHLPAAVITSLFQSVTCRTAGFNSIDLNELSNISLLLMILLMLVGGAPGSTAGGIKVTTLRVMAAFYRSRLTGGKQAVIGNIAASRQTVDKALSLTLYTLLLVSAAVFLLHFTEAADLAHATSRGMLLEIGFEAASALGTAGLSMGLTPSLTVAGKCIVMVLMFVGRLGPLIFLAVLQEYRKEELIARPEGELLIG
jgi:trk system potassium uptake protein TrkH